MTVLPSNLSSQSADLSKKSQAWLDAAASALKPAARRTASEITKLSEPIAAHVRKRPVTYAVGALLVGAGIGLLINRKARTTVADTLSRSWDLASDESGRAAETMRGLLRR